MCASSSQAEYHTARKEKNGPEETYTFQGACKTIIKTTPMGGMLASMREHTLVLTSRLHSNFEMAAKPQHPCSFSEQHPCSFSDSSHIFLQAVPCILQLVASLLGAFARLAADVISCRLDLPLGLPILLLRSIKTKHNK